MIYVMFSCNENKEFSSMRMLGATTSIDKVKKELKRMIATEEVEYNQEKFNANDNWSVYNLNTEFDYVFIEEVKDGDFVN